MKLYLSSFGFGDHGARLSEMVGGRRRAKVILNALDGANPEARAVRLDREIQALAGLDIEAAELDLREFVVGDEEESAARLANAVAEVDLLWVRGGNTFVLCRAFVQSGLAELLLNKLQTTDFVYGGFSAGVCVLGPTLRGIELVDDPAHTPQPYRHTDMRSGLGVLPFCVAPHFRSTHPESADVEKLVEFYIADHQPFIALVDGEVLLHDEPQGYRVLPRLDRL